MRRYYSLEDLPEDFPLNNRLTVAGLIAILTSVALDVGLQQIYAAKVIFESSGNEHMSNTLYYRFDNAGPFDLPFIGADHLAYQLKQEIVPKMAAILPANVLIKTLRIQAFSPVFGLKMLAPYEESVNIRGQGGNNVQLKTDRVAANIRLNVSANGFTQHLQNVLGLLPTGGRIYFGPLDISQVGMGETLTQQFFEHAEPLVGKLSDRLFNETPTGTFVPLRIARHGFTVPVLGRVNIFTGWADINTASIQSEAVFLKGRNS